MKLTKEQAKEINGLRKIANKRAIKIWISAIFITGAIILIQAIIGKWIIKLIGIELSMLEAIIAVIITNFIVGFLKIVKYAEKKRKQK